MSATSCSRPASVNCAHGPLAEALDVHGAPGGEVGDALHPLTRAVDVDAEGVALAVEAHERLAAHRARRSGTSTAAGPPGGAAAPGPRTSGMTSPARRTTTVSPGPDVLDPDLVLVVQGGQRHLGPADDDRLEHGERRGLPGPADRHHDVLEQGGLLLRRELVGDGPPRRLGRGPELAALGQVVDLDHDPVDLVVERVAVVQPAPAVVVDLLEAVHQLDVGVDREAGRRIQSRVCVWSVKVGPPSTSPSW